MLLSAYSKHSMAAVAEWKHSGSGVFSLIFIIARLKFVRSSNCAFFTVWVTRQQRTDFFFFCCLSHKHSSAESFTFPQTDDDDKLYFWRILESVCWRKGINVVTGWFFSPSPHKLTLLMACFQRHYKIPAGGLLGVSEVDPASPTSDSV